jgi:K+-sensing histidine kinase KdpD
MRSLKAVLSAGEAIGLILLVTAVLWQLNLATGSSHHLIYIYLFPVALIAALYNGRVALFSTAIAMVCADYFLQEPLFSLANDNPREYGDLFVFAILAATTIQFIRVLVRPRLKSFKAGSRYRGGSKSLPASSSASPIHGIKGNYPD